MKVRAKFKCTSSNKDGWEFEAVGSDGKPKGIENEKFWKYTPSGHLVLGLSENYYQGEHPTVGKEYYLDIMEA